MKRRKEGSKASTVPFSESLEKRLALYALAATAGGVGVLGHVPPAYANIIVDTTPISTSTGGILSINGVNRIAFIDSPGTEAGVLRAYAWYGNDFTGPLYKGAIIGSSGQVMVRTSFLAYNVFHVLDTPGTPGYQIVDSTVFGPWANVSAYLGFKFVSHNKPYFGWAHLSVKANPRTGETAYISEFAYETDPNTPIRAGQTSVPEPGTLSLLALGTVGLFALRKKKMAAEAARKSEVNG